MAFDDTPPKKSEKPAKLVRKSTVRYSRNTTLRSTEIISKDSFEFIKHIGEGAYGKVFLVKKKNTGKLYALKELDKERI